MAEGSELLWEQQKRLLTWQKKIMVQLRLQWLSLQVFHAVISNILRIENKGLIEKSARGVQILPEAWDDEMFKLQNRFMRGIYSHATIKGLPVNQDKETLWASRYD